MLGGGIGGLVTAYNVAKRASKEEAEVIMIDRTGYHVYLPSLPWVAMGMREPRDIMRPLSLLEKKGIKVLVDEVKQIRPEEHTVITSSAKINYDYLVVSLGSIPREDKVPADDNVCTPWTPDGAVKCRRALRNFKKGTVVIAPMSLPYKCPPAPFEVAFLTKYLMEQRGLDSEVNVKVVHPWKVPFEPFGPVIVSAFSKMLSQYNIEFVGGAEIEKIGNGKLVTKQGETIAYDLAMVVPPYEPPEPIKTSGIDNPQAYGYMKVDKRTLKLPGYDNVYGIGDVVAPSLNLGMGGVFAHFQGEYVASAIVDELRGAYVGYDYNRGGMCVFDAGYFASIAYCDFTKRIFKNDYPDCTMVGAMKAFRVAKFAFEKFWLSKWF